jgi:hypothetical protein
MCIGTFSPLMALCNPFAIFPRFFWKLPRMEWSCCLFVFLTRVTCLDSILHLLIFHMQEPQVTLMCCGISWHAGCGKSPQNATILYTRLCFPDTVWCEFSYFCLLWSSPYHIFSNSRLHWIFTCPGFHLLCSHECCVCVHQHLHS